MNQSTTPSHYSLNQKQLYILKLTYKFRFITAPLLARHRNVTVSTTNIVINRLYKQGYLGRHYDKKTHKLPNRPATYYLQNKAIRYLRDDTILSDKGLNVCYKDKHLNQKFIDSSLLIYKSQLDIRDKHPDYIFFTANELREYDYYPKILPQLYYYKPLEDNGRQEYMLDIFTDTLFFYIKKRIDQYVAHYENGEWKRKQYPTIVLIVPYSRLQEKAAKYFEDARDGIFADESDLPFRVNLSVATQALLCYNINYV